MEKKYKLVKAYPGSPKVGTVATVQTFGGFIVGQPEFWQEIIEFPVGTQVVDTETQFIYTKAKSGIWNYIIDESDIGEDKRFQVIKSNSKADWEIQSLLSTDTRKVPLIILDKTDVYPDFGEWLKYPEHWKIHSILRVRDNLIFTLGDLVKFEGGKPFKISEFKIREKDEAIVISSLEYTYICTLDELSQLKRVLLTTDDGVGILGGDSYFFIKKDLSSPEIGKINSAGFSSSRDKNFIYFSSYEAASEYLINHLKCFSIQDFKYVLALPGNEIILPLTEMATAKIKKS